MTKYIRYILLISSFILIITSCRPKDLEGAFVHYNASRYDQALPLAKISTQQYPENAEAWYLLGMLYSKKDSIKQMVHAFEKSVSLENTFKIQIQNERSQLYAKKFNSGAKNFNTFNVMEDKTSDEAVKVLEKSIKDFRESDILKPTFAAGNLATQGLLILGREDEALESYKELTKTYADTAASWISLGRYYFNKQDYKSAAENFQKASEIDTNNAEAFVLLAHSYDYLGDYVKAEPAYLKAVTLDTEDSAILFNLGLLYYKTASSTDLSIDEKMDRYAKSVEQFEKSIALNADFVNAFQLKGNAELLLDRLEDAKKTLEEGVSRFPDDKQMWDDLAICYAKLGEKKKAEDAAARANQL